MTGCENSLSCVAYEEAFTYHRGQGTADQDRRGSSSELQSLVKNIKTYLLFFGSRIPCYPKAACLSISTSQQQAQDLGYRRCLILVCETLKLLQVLICFCFLRLHEKFHSCWWRWKMSFWGHLVINFNLQCVLALPSTSPVLASSPHLREPLGPLLARPVREFRKPA